MIVKNTGVGSSAMIKQLKGLIIFHPVFKFD